MKKILSLFVLCLMTASVFAADYYTPLKSIVNNSASRENCFVTDVVPVTETKVAVGFNVRAENGWCAIFSGRNTHAGTGISLYKNGNNSNLGYFTGSTTGGGDNFAPLTCGKDYDVVADVTNLKVTVDGETTDYPTGNTVTNETSRCLSFFANPEWDDPMRGAIYYFTVYNGDEVIRNYKPVMRQKDGAIGYLDEVNNTFIQPAKVDEQGDACYSYETIEGNFYFTGFSQNRYTVKVGQIVEIVPVYVGEAPGEFSIRAGSAVSVDGLTVTGVKAGVIQLVVSVGSGANKWTRKVELEVIDDSKTSYTEVDYIYFDGDNENYKNYYETGYLPKWNTVIDVNFKGYEKSKGSWRAIFSGRDNTSNGMSFYQNGNGNDFGYFVSGNNNDYAGSYSANTDYTVNFTKDALTVNGTVTATKEGITEENFNAGNHTISIFSGANDWPFYGEISYFKISEGENTIHEYVPVVRHDGVACLYDKTTNTLVEPNGAGFYVGLNEDNTTSQVVVLEDSKKIFKGFTDKLSVDLTNGNIEDYTLTWESSDASVAEVAEDGTITAKGLGNATITMTAVKGDDFWKLTSTVEVISSVIPVGGTENWDGENDIILGSIRKSGDAYKAAHTWTVTSNEGYGDWSTSNPKYNVIIGTPSTDEAGNEWFATDYEMTNDMNASWVYSSTALPNFGPNENPGDVYVRRYFTTVAGATLPETVYMPAAHDDAPCEYYINGVKVWSRTGYEPGVNGWYEDEIVRLTDEQKALIKTDGSVNVFAYHVHQNWGGRYADGGLYGNNGNVANDFNNNDSRKRLENALAQAETVEGVDPEVIEYAKNASVCLQDAGLALDKIRFELKKALAPRHDYSALASAEPADGLECWLYNVGTGMFLAGSNDWGTHASVEPNISSWPMVLRTNTSGNNRYAIQTNLPNGARGANDGLGHNGYVDCGYGDDFTTAEGWAWEFQAVGDGTYRIINAQNGGDNIYLGVTKDYRYQVDTDKAGADDPYNLWKVITKEQFEALAEAATADNGADVTYNIHQANFSQNDFDGNDKGGANADLNDSKWERNAGSIWNWKGNDANGDYVFEAWNARPEDGKMYLKQTIENLRPGKYVVSANGYYRDGNYDSAINGNDRQLAYLYAGTEENQALLPSILDGANKGAGYGNTAHMDILIPDGCRDAAKFFQYGQYNVEVEVEVAEDGVLEFGVCRPDDNLYEGDWVVVDNFRLTYYGDAAPYVPAEFVSITPAPEDGDITLDTEFVVTFSQPVTFSESLSGIGMGPGYYCPATVSQSEDGKVITVSIDKESLEMILGTEVTDINQLSEYSEGKFYVELYNVKDAKTGEKLPGNLSEDDDDYEAGFYRWTYSGGEYEAPTIVVTPEAGDVETLEDFTFALSNGGLIFPTSNDGVDITIADADGNVVATITSDDLSENPTIDEEMMMPVALNVTLAEPITKAGTYTMTIPAGMFYLGYNMAENEEMTVVYNVSGLPEPETWTKTGYVMPIESWGTDIFWTDACAQEVTVTGTVGSNVIEISQDSYGYHNVITVTANEDDGCDAILYNGEAQPGWGYFDFGSSYSQYVYPSNCYANADQDYGYVTLYGWFDDGDAKYVDIEWYEGAKEDAEAWKAITGIKNVNADSDSEATYNLAGQRVKASTKGILIKNGKKYLVK